MEAITLIKKLGEYGITLTVEDDHLVTNSDKPIPRGISLTISAQEKQLISHLKRNLDPQQPEPVSPTSVVPNVPPESELFRNRGETYRNAVMIHLPLKMLESLMVWTSYYHELRIQHPNGLTLNATPEHVRDALDLHLWGTVQISDDGGRWLVLSWGDVPESALEGLRDLQTEELLVPEQVAA